MWFFNKTKNLSEVEKESIALLSTGAFNSRKLDSITVTVETAYICFRKANIVMMKLYIFRYYVITRILKEDTDIEA